MQVLMDKSAYIEKPLQPVWKDNEHHKLLYSALLYASPTDTIEKKEPIVTKRSAARHSEIDDKKKEPKGIRKIFDKLLSRFKKNKDKEEEQ